MGLLGGIEGGRPGTFLGHAAREKNNKKYEIVRKNYGERDKIRENKGNVTK